MGYWGWRHMLAVCVSVLVVACSLDQEASPTTLPTPFAPPLTLIAHAPGAPPTPLSAVIPTLPASAPTPLYYVINAGDTLSEIARRFGVELAVLQAANPTLDPLRLPVGAAILIPMPRFGPDGQPLSVQEALPSLELPPPKCSPAGSGGILCLGEVRNPTGEALDRVVVGLRLLRADGGLLAEGAVGIQQGVLPPGGAAPYGLMLRANWLEYRAAGAVLLRARRAESFWRSVEVSEIIPRQSGEGTRVEALVRNPLAEPVRLARAVLTLRDAAGGVTGFRVTALDQTLGPGEAARLTVWARGLRAGGAAALFVEAVAAR